MPPRRGKKKAVYQYVYVDSPEVQTLAHGFVRKEYYESGYVRALIEANSVAARALAANSGTRNAKSAFMVGIPASLGVGAFIIPATEKEVISKLSLGGRAELNRAFKAGKIAPDPDMPGLVRSIIQGEPIMKTFHYDPGLPPKTKVHTGPSTRATRATPSSLDEYTKGLNNLSSLVEGLERDVERRASVHYSTFGEGVTSKEHDAPLISSWV